MTACTKQEMLQPIQAVSPWLLGASDASQCMQRACWEAVQDPFPARSLHNYLVPFLRNLPPVLLYSSYEKTDTHPNPSKTGGRSGQCQDEPAMHRPAGRSHLGCGPIGQQVLGCQQIRRRTRYGPSLVSTLAELPG